MSERPTEQAEQFKWHDYPSGSASGLAVRFASATPSDVTIVWKGGVDFDVLKNFFVSSVDQISAHHGYVRGWVVNQDGQQCLPVTDIHAIRFPDGELAEATFLRLECLSSVPDSTEFEQPDFVVFANLDNDASDLNELQQSVGIYLQNWVNLRQLNGSLTQVVAATKSEYLPAAYEQSIVSESLHHIERYY